MDFLEKVFPVSFRFTDSIRDLLIGVLIYIAANAIAGIVIALLAPVPFLGLLASAFGTLFATYCNVGIVIQILAYAKVLK